MKIIDTHLHLYLPEFDLDRNQVLSASKQAGVEALCLPNIDLDSVGPMLSLCSAEPDFCFPMMGLHPCSVKENYKEVLNKLEQHLSSHAFVGIGEIGLDLYWDKTFLEEQKNAFNIQCRWAVDQNLPVSMHTRNAFEETYLLLKDMEHRPSGVFHCFSGTIEQAQRAINLGYYLGIGGVVSFKNAGLDQVIEKIGLEFLVLETDAPYLAPVPYRGKRNSPEYLPLIVDKIAAILNSTREEVCRVTSANARKIFSLK